MYSSSLYLMIQGNLMNKGFCFILQYLIDEIRIRTIPKAGK